MASSSPPAAPPRKIAHTTYGKKGGRSLQYVEARARAVGGADLGSGSGTETSREVKDQKELGLGDMGDTDVPESWDGLDGSSQYDEEEPEVPEEREEAGPSRSARYGTKKGPPRAAKRKRAVSPLPENNGQLLGRAPPPGAPAIAPGVQRGVKRAKYEQIASGSGIGSGQTDIFKRQMARHSMMEKTKPDSPLAGSHNANLSLPQTDISPSPFFGAPELQLQPSPFSPARIPPPRQSSASPITPMMSPEKRVARLPPGPPSTPPKDLSAIYRAVSPSPRAQGRSKPKGRMLTRTESTGHADTDTARRHAELTASPVKLAASASLGSLDKGEMLLVPGRRLTFGGSLPEKGLTSSPGKVSSAGSDLGTPPKRGMLGRVQSMSESPSKLAGPARKTYGKSRSFMTQVEEIGSPGPSRLSSAGKGPVLSPDPANQAFVEGIHPGSSPKGIPRQSYNDLRKQFAMDNSSGDADVEEAQSPETARANNLRSKGQNRRFMDELGYLMDGIQETGVSVRRHSALDLLGKSMKEDWYGKLCICGEVETLLKALLSARQDMADEVLDLATLLYITRLSQSLAIMREALRTSLHETLQFLAGIASTGNLTFGDGPHERGRKGAVKPSMLELRSIRNKLAVAPEKTLQSSAIAIATNLLATLLTSLESDPDALEQHVSSLDIISGTMAMMNRSGSRLTAWLDEQAGLKVSVPRNVPDLRYLSAGMRILKLAMLSTRRLTELGVRTSPTLALLLMDCAGAADIDANLTWPRTEAEETRSSCLQLTFALAAISPSWCTYLGSQMSNVYTILRLINRSRTRISESQARNDGDPDDAQSSEASGRESLMLLVGILYHLIDKFDLQAFLGLDICDSIARSATCVRRCSCGESASAGQVILQLYQQERSKSNDAESAFLSGYLALLITRIMRLNTSPNGILAELDDEERDSMYGALVDSLADFETVFAKVHNVMLQGLRDPDAGRCSESDSGSTQEGDEEDGCKSIGKGDDVTLEQAAEALEYLRALQNEKRSNEQ